MAPTPAAARSISSLADLGCERVLGLALPRRLVEHIAVLPLRLGGVQREVGVTQQLIHRPLLTDRNADARAYGDDRAAVIEGDRLAQHLDQALGDPMWPAFIAR